MPCPRVAAALCLPLLFTGRGEELAVRYEQGTTLTLTVTQGFEAELVELQQSVEVNGEEQDIGEMDTPEVTLAQNERTVFRDEALAVEDGDFRRLRRTFVTLESHSEQEFTPPEGDAQTVERERESELEGLSVIFTWDEDSEAFEVAFDDEGHDEELLEGLEAVADMRWLLPEGDVEVGQRWDLGTRAFHRLTTPGGDLALLAEDDDPDEARERSDQIAENYDGDFEAEYGGLRDEDGVQVAVIALQADLGTWYVEESEVEGPQGTMTVNGRVELAFDLEGELLWDVAAGHARSVRLTGELQVETTNDRQMSQGGNDVLLSVAQTFEGELTFELAVE